MYRMALASSHAARTRPCWLAGGAGDRAKVAARRGDACGSREGPRVKSTSVVGAPRACIVRHSYYPHELNVRREAQALRDDGFDVSVICLRGEGEASREVVDGVEVRRMPVGHRRGAIPRYLVEYNLFFVLASAVLLWAHLQRRFSVVQVNTMPDYLVFVALLPRLLGARVVLHVHEPMPELFATLFEGARYRPFITAIRWSERLAVAFADRVLTVTEQMKQRLVERGADASKITVVLNVPDARTLAIEDGGAAVSGGARYIVTHGAIEERYGPDLIVRALGLVRDEFADLEFHLLGAGDYVGEVLALAEELGVGSRVHYLGFVPLDQMLREVRGARAGIVPMRSNAYSNLVHTNKMFEYMELGRPVIASRLDSVAAYFGDDAIAYFKSDDAFELAERIREVLTQPQVGEGRARCASSIYLELRWERAREVYLGVHRALLVASGARLA